MIYYGTIEPPNPITGDMYMCLTTGNMNVYDGTSWINLGGINGQAPAPEPLPPMRKQGDLIWVSDMHIDDRELILKAGDQTGVNLLWVDEVADQYDLDTDHRAKFYGSLWSYDRDLSQFWKRYWELKGE